jgi:hypothetical protein
VVEVEEVEDAEAAAPLADIGADHDGVGADALDHDGVDSDVMAEVLAAVLTGPRAAPPRVASASSPGMAAASQAPWPVSWADAAATSAGLPLRPDGFRVTRTPSPSVSVASDREAPLALGAPAAAAAARPAGDLPPRPPQPGARARLRAARSFAASHGGGGEGGDGGDGDGDGAST